MMGLKTKKRNRLSVQNDARIALSVTEPRITALAMQMRDNIILAVILSKTKLTEK